MNNKVEIRPEDLKDLKEGTLVTLSFNDGSMYSGNYKGFDNETIMLESKDSEIAIGLPFDRLTHFYNDSAMADSPV